MFKSPYFCIVVPIYRTPSSYLKQCIDSILCQSFEDFNLILVDDGSPDRCGEICDYYATIDGRVNVIHKQNEGVAAARNTGIDACCGEWIVFVDPDDWIEPNYLEVFYNLSLTNDSEILICACYVNYLHRQICNPFFKDDEIYAKCTDKDRMLLQFLCANIYGDNLCTADVGSPWAKVYKKSLIDRLGLRFNEHLKRMEDNAFNLYAFENANAILYKKYYLYHYRKSIHSGFSQFAPDIEQNYELFFNILDEFIIRENKTKVFKDAYNIKVLNSIYVYCKMKYFHRKNPLPFRQRLAALNQLLCMDKYGNPIRNIQASYLGKAEKIFYYAVRSKSVLLLYFLYWSKVLLYWITHKNI